MGPGSTEHLKPFGSDLKRVPFGKKHSFRPNLATPGPGAYDAGRADRLIKSQSQAHSIRARPKDAKSQKIETDAGRYSPHKEFGSGLNRFTLGQKGRDLSESPTPPPGKYNPEGALLLTKPRSAAMLITRPSTARRNSGTECQSPAPGHHFDSSRGFGSTGKSVTIAVRTQKWKPLNDNPGPGSHEASDALTRPSTRGAEIGRSKTSRDGFLQT